MSKIYSKEWEITQVNMVNDVWARLTVNGEGYSLMEFYDRWDYRIMIDGQLYLNYVFGRHKMGDIKEA
jgi:hypothetical protein